MPEVEPLTTWDRDHQISAYRDLAVFRAHLPDAERRLSVQRIEDAVGRRVNLDYYACRIDRLPPGSSASKLAREIRLGLTSFSGKLAEFTPRSDNDDTRWRSDEPVNSVIHIDMGVGWGNIEDGTVICSYADPTSWIFSTVSSKYDDWDHPVSGNRLFALEGRGDGGYIFYTMGVDRATGVLDWALDGLVFGKADELWRRVMQGVCDSVNAQGGAADLGGQGSIQPKWKDFLDDVIRASGGDDVRRANEQLSELDESDVWLAGESRRLQRENVEQRRRLADLSTTMPGGKAGSGAAHAAAQASQQSVDAGRRLHEDAERVNREMLAAQERMRSVSRAQQEVESRVRRNNDERHNIMRQREIATNNMMATAERNSDSARRSSEEARRTTERILRANVTTGEPTIRYVPPATVRGEVRHGELSIEYRPPRTRSPDVRRSPRPRRNETGLVSHRVFVTPRTVACRNQ